MRATRAGAVALALAIVSGCTNSPGLSNGSVSACYRAIPVGKAAVHDQSATLIGVHRISLDRVVDRLPPDARREMAAENDTAVCAMAFKGRFGPGQVELAPPDRQGSYALVVVSSRQLHLIASFVLTHLPRAFGGRTL